MNVAFSLNPTRPPLRYVDLSKFTEDELFDRKNTIVIIDETISEIVSKFLEKIQEFIVEKEKSSQELISFSQNKTNHSL